MGSVIQDSLAHRYDEANSIWYYYYSFFNRIESPLLTITHGDEGRSTGWVNVLINNDTNLRLYAVSDRTVGMKIDNTARGDTVVFYSGNHPIIVGYSNNVFWLRQKNSDGTTMFSFTYEKIGNHRLKASTYQDESPVGTQLLDDFSGITYNHAQILSHSLGEANKIDYMNDKLFTGGYVSDFEDPNFKQCSAVTAGQVITFGGKNYYPFTSHILLSLDD